MNAKLKGYRVMAGYSQKDAASLLGISIAMYNYCENGKRSFLTEQEDKLFRIIKKKIPGITKEELFPTNKG